jgi:formylglycine-generating enzyme required for sulfatase activity
MEPIRFENSVGMCLEPIDAGSFIQGSSVNERAEGRDDDERERGVSFKSPFWMGAHEVSQRAWCKIMGPMKSDHYLGDDMPAHSVTWDEANEFCQRLTAEEHQFRSLPKMLEYRLPTEAEWEYACRAGTREPRYGPIQDIAWVNQDSLQPLGKLCPNKWNLYDMLGNCFEWCLDSYKSSYARQGNNIPDPFEHSADPMVPKIIRGGCFQTGPQYARAAARTKVSATKRSGRIGFRVVVAFVDRNPLKLHQAQTKTPK